MVRTSIAAALRRIPCVVLALMLEAQSVFAANEVYCSARDTNLDLKLQASVDPRAGEGVVPGSLKGVLQVHHQKVPRDRRAWPLDGRSIAQYWNVGGELKLRLLLQSGDDAVDLIIETRSRPGSAGDYAGSFRLETTDGVRVTGRVECVRG